MRNTRVKLEGHFSNISLGKGNSSQKRTGTLSRPYNFSCKIESISHHTKGVRIKETYGQNLSLVPQGGFALGHQRDRCVIAF